MIEFGNVWKLSPNRQDIGLTGKWNAIDGLVIIPYERESEQLIFRWIL